METTTTPAALHQNGSAVNSAGAGAVNSGANGAASGAKDVSSGANGAQSAQAKMDLGERKALWESLVCNFHFCQSCPLPDILNSDPGTAC